MILKKEHNKLEAGHKKILRMSLVVLRKRRLIRLLRLLTLMLITLSASGFKKLMYSKEIDGSRALASDLSYGGIDILIAPHHGLKWAFCTEMFDCLPNGKVRCLNIVSEKANNPNENRDVDDRYSLSDYCSGENNLETSNGVGQNNCRRTSQGHICIDLSKEGRPDIQIIQETNKMFDWFIGKNSD